jgi:hypothetical protein
MNNQWVSRWLFDFLKKKSRITVIYQNRVFDFLITVVGYTSEPGI